MKQQGGPDGTSLTIEDTEVTKRELIEVLEALDCDDDTDVIIDEDHSEDPGELSVKVSRNQDEILIIVANPRGAH